MKKLKNFSLKNLFHSNKFVLVFSLLAAIVSWMIITIVQAPDTEKTISDVAVTIPIEGSAANQLGLDIVDDGNITQKVSVIIKGPNYVVSSLSADDVSVSASLSNVNAPGRFNLELKAAKLSAGEYEIVGTNPSTILVSFDYIDTKQFTVSAEAEGASAIEGLVAESAVVSDTNYSTLTIKGPRTEMEKIDRVAARASVNQTLSITSTFTAEIVLLDKDGNEISPTAFTITAADGTEVSTVQISVPISKVKEVPVNVTFANDPGGYASDPLEYELSFSTVNIIGPPETIDSINSISLEEIDFFNISPDKDEFEVAPVLPDGVKLVDQIGTVKVTFTELSSYTTRTFTVSQFEGQGGSGTLKSSIRNVQVCGPRSVVRRLSSDDLVAYADLSGKTVGDHTIEVTIKATTSNRVWQVGTYNATITIQ